MKLGRIADSYSYFSDTMRKLADAIDVSMIHYNKCIVFVRGCRPFYIEKYTPSDHPNYHLTGYADETKMLTDEFLDKFYSCLLKDESDV